MYQCIRKGEGKEGLQDDGNRLWKRGCLMFRRTLEEALNAGCTGKGYDHKGKPKYCFRKLIYTILFFTAEDEERLE